MNAASIAPDLRKALMRGKTVDLPGGVVLRPPRTAGARGAAGCFRIDWYEDGARQQKARRELSAAWALAVDASHRQQIMEEVAVTGHRLRASIDELTANFLNTDLHPKWGESRAKTVTSLTRNWLVAPHILVTSIEGRRVPFSEVVLQDLTTGMLTEACSHVRAARAWSTYKEVHGIAKSLIGWAIKQRFLPKDQDMREDFELWPKPEPASAHSTMASDLAIDPESIPPTAELNQFGQAIGERYGWRQQTLIEFLTWIGFRIGEALVLRNDARFRWDGVNGCWHVWVFERVQHSKAATAPPKHGRLRWAWVPPHMTDTVSHILDQTPSDGVLFPAAKGGLMPVSRWHRSRFTRTAEAIGWPERADWIEKSQEERRWLWTPHSARHHAATWMLSPSPHGLGIPADDIAKFFGHRSGWQIWEMYGHSLPDVGGRAMAAGLAAGDPRKR